MSSHGPLSRAAKHAGLHSDTGVGEKAGIAHPGFRRAGRILAKLDRTRRTRVAVTGIRIETTILTANHPMEAGILRQSEDPRRIFDTW